MKYLLLVMALAISGCGASGNVNKAATKTNAENACKKRGMILEKIAYKLTSAGVTCVDPSTLEYSQLKLHSAVWNPEK